MARSSATRKGNGTGWGGAAKGAGTSKAVRAPDFEAGNKVAAGPHDMSGAEKRAQMIAIYEQVAEDTTQPGQTRINAVEKWLDRHEGKPGQSVKLQGDADNPVEIVYSWADAADAE